MARAKQKNQAGSYKCGHCGGLGHNARTCPEKADGKVKTKAAKKKAAKSKPKKATPAKKKPAEKAPSSPSEPEKVFDFDDGEDMALPDAPPPGAKLSIPKRKRDRSKAELAFWAATEKKLAPDAVAPAGELALQIPRISSGNFGLDVALYGGWPQGRVCRPWGMPKSGKTGTCLNTVATYQREHCSECFQRKCNCKSRDVPDVVWVDAENRMNSMLHWPRDHGINLDCMRILCPPTGQNVVDFVDHIIREQKVAKVGLIIVDSLAHIVSQDVINKPTLDGVTVGRNAHLLNSAWQKWTSASMSLGIQNERKPTILCINQIRHKVGQNFGSPEVMPGGLGQEFATTVDVRFGSGPMTYVVWDDKKRTWVAKQKKYKSTFKPPPDAAPDFVTISYRVTASGHCPPGRYGEFNYWLQATHGHRCGDPDNGLQLWNYCKRYNLIEQEGHTKRLFGHEARTFDELKELFRGDSKAHKKAWRILMKQLVS